jgi:hypothetical protein
VKNTLRTSLMGFVAGSMMLGMMAVPMNALACPHHHHDRDSLCLAVNDGSNNLFNLKIEHHEMVSPPQGETRVVRGIINSAEPALGIVLRTGAHSAVINMNGSVAGFFNAFQITYNSDAGTGTGRVLGELSAHPHVTVTEFQCH